MANFLNLEHEEDSFYIGNCPFCPAQDYFVICTEEGFAYCRNCKFGTQSLDFLAARLPALARLS